MTTRILITGAAGTIGTMLRPRMARPQRIHRLLDISPMPGAEPDEPVEIITAISPTWTRCDTPRKTSMR
jgi:uronate dehydrogenase